MSHKKAASPLYLESAEIVALQNHIRAMQQFNDQLLRVIAENLPSTGPTLGKLNDGYLKNLSTIEATRSHMIFEGRGTRGLALAAAIRTEEDQAAYDALIRKPLVENADLTPLSKLIDNLFALNDTAGKSTWISQSLISRQECPLEPILQPAPDEEIQVRKMEDGIYLTDHGFEMVVKVDEDSSIMFSPTGSLRIVSFCPIEDSDISHVCANYLDVEKACVAVQSLIDKAGLRDITVADRMELHRVATLCSVDDLKNLGVVKNGKEFTFVLAENYMLTTNARGVGRIEERPSTTKWEELSLLTRRYLYNEYVGKLQSLIQTSEAK